MDASSCPSVRAFSTARAGIEVWARTPLIRTLVSTTIRSRVIAGQECRELFFGQSGGCSLRRDLIAQIEECADVARPQPLVLRHRQDDGNVPVLATDDDRFPLRIVQDGTQAVLGFGRGDSLHE